MKQIELYKPQSIKILVTPTLVKTYFMQMPIIEL